MPQYEKLEGSALEKAVAELDGWTLVEGKLHKKVKLKDFADAWAFMTKVAMEAHLLDHHPEWSNVYSTVVIDLVTHHAGGITTLDIKLAKKINSYL